MKARISASLVALTLILGAAPQPAPAEATGPRLPTGFTHDPKDDVSGDYELAPQVKFGKWELRKITLGTPQNFAEYEKGPHGPSQSPDCSSDAPFVISFADVTSPKELNEDTGGSDYSDWRCVLPTAYKIDGNHVAFVGKDAAFGRVVFTGTFDLADIKRMRNANNAWWERCGNTFVMSGPCKNIPLTGDFVVGEHVWKNVKLPYTPPGMGD